MALTDVQNEFLKLQLANNPEFQAAYMPNVITQPPVGPLYNVNISRDRPANVYYENLNYEQFRRKNELLGKIIKRKPREDSSPPSRMPRPPVQIDASILPPSRRGPLPPERDLKAIWENYMKPPKGAEFRDINVPYDTPGSKINIKGVGDTDFAYIRPGEMTYEDQPITGKQTSAIYMSPRILEDYGTAPTSPRNQMTPTPDWYKELGDAYDIKIPETMDQAHINDLIEGIISHETSHAVSDKPAFKDISERATTIDFKQMYPGISQEAFDALVQAGVKDPYQRMEDPYHQEELYTRAKDLERLKIEHPNTWKTHPMRDLIIARIKKHHGFKKLPRHPSKYETYQKKIEPEVKAYFKKVKGDDKKKKWTPPQQTGGDGGVHGGGGRPRPDKPGGFTDPGKGSYGPHKADGGLINYFKYGGYLG